MGARGEWRRLADHRRIPCGFSVAVRNIQSFAIRPERYKERLDGVYTKLGPDPKGIRESIQELRRLIDEVNELAKTSTGRKPDEYE